MRWPWHKRHRNGLSCRAVDYHAAMLEERCQRQVVVITQLHTELSRLHVQLLREQAKGQAQVDDPSLRRMVFFLN